MDDNNKIVIEISPTPTKITLSEKTTKTASAKCLPVHEKFVCSYDDCDKAFSKLNRLIQHERVHTGERPFNCTYENCTKSYARSSHLKRHVEQTHVKIRTPGNVVICQEDGCYKNFVSKDSLKKHLKVVHGLNGKDNDDDKYFCPVDGCKASFSKRFQLRHHDYQEHKGSTLFQCMECQKKFASHSKLKRHSKMHEGYKCAVCSEVFTKWSMLRRHKSQEHKEIIACKLCNQKFKSNSKLNTHSTIHHQQQININLISDDENETETDCYSLKQSDGDNDDDVKMENPKELESNKDSKISMNISNRASNNSNSNNNKNNDDEALNDNNNNNNYSIIDNNSNNHNGFKSESETVQIETAKNPVVSLYKAFKCNVNGCVRSYTTRYNLKTHIRICHLENNNNNNNNNTYNNNCNNNDSNSNNNKTCLPLFVCSVEGCGMSLSTKQKLQFHSITHTEKYISMKDAKKLQRNKQPKSNHNQIKQENLSALVNLHKRITLSEKPAEIFDEEDQMKETQRRFNLKIGRYFRSLISEENNEKI